MQAGAREFVSYEKRMKKCLSYRTALKGWTMGLPWDSLSEFGKCLSLVVKDFQYH